MVGRCAVANCKSRRGQPGRVRFFSIPAIIKNQCDRTLELSIKRRAEWLACIRRPDLHLQENIGQKYTICSRHFIKGIPSKLFEVKDPDWSPSVNLGYLLPETWNKIKNGDTKSVCSPSLESESSNLIETIKCEVDPLALSLLEDENDMQSYEPGPISAEESGSSGMEDYVTLVPQPAAECNKQSSTNSAFTALDHTILPSAQLGGPNNRINTKGLSTDFNGPIFKSKFLRLIIKTDVGCQTDVRGSLMDQNTSLIEELHRKVNFLSSQVNQLKKENSELENRRHITDSQVLRLTNNLAEVRCEKNNCEVEIAELKLKISSYEFSENSFENDEKKIKFLTGLSNYSMLMKIFGSLRDLIVGSARCLLTNFQQFILVLMRLRLGLQERDLAYRFRVSQGTVSRIFYKWIEVMSKSLEIPEAQPDREILRGRYAFLKSLKLPSDLKTVYLDIDVSDETELEFHVVRVCCSLVHLCPEPIGH